MATNAEKQLKMFKRLMLGKLCFQRAAALAEHMLKTRPEPLGLVYSPMVTGIVGTYMRPFMSANGLGSLPPEFEKLPTPILQEYHDHVKEARHKLHAHHDLLSAATFTIESGEQPLCMKVRFDGTSTLALQPDLPEIGEHTFPHIVQLCQMQEKRCTMAIQELWPSLTSGKQYQIGMYVVGLDFP